MTDLLHLAVVLDLLGLWMYGSEILYELLCQSILRRTPTGGAAAGLATLVDGGTCVRVPPHPPRGTSRGPGHAGVWRHVLPGPGHALGALGSLTRLPGLTAAAAFSSVRSFSGRLMLRPCEHPLLHHTKRHRFAASLSVHVTTHSPREPRAY